MDIFITILIVLFLLGWLLAKMLPRILVWAFNRSMKKMAENARNYAENAENTEGEVIIKKSREEKIVDDTIGEYIDFEETKE